MSSAVAAHNQHVSGDNSPDATSIPEESIPAPESESSVPAPERRTTERLSHAQNASVDVPVHAQDECRDHFLVSHETLGWDDEDEV